MRLPQLPSGALHARQIYENVVERATSVVQEGGAAERLYPRANCPPGDNSAICQKPVDATNSQTLPIVLGAVIPITCAVVVLFYLHRRNKKKQRLEDARDPHKSLDFGLDLAMPEQAHKKRSKKGAPPEMSLQDVHGELRAERNKTRGISMDMLGSPYLLPNGLGGSRESMHSMSRSVQDEHDPYRPVGMMRSSTDTSRSPRPFNEAGSVYSVSTLQHDKSTLLSNAQNVSSSTPRRSNSLPRIETSTFDVGPLRQLNSATPSSPKNSVSSPEQLSLPMIYETNGKLSPTPSPPPTELETASFPLPPEHPLPPPPVESPPADPSRPPRSSSMGGPMNGPRVPRKSSASFGAGLIGGQQRTSASSYYHEDAPPMPPPKVMEPELDPMYEFEPEGHEYDIDPDMIYNGRYSIDNSAPSQQHPMQANRMSAMGLRPLPPDHPEENPEQRANRIRSFYKEYFDDSRPHPAYAHYEEDWDAGYYFDGGYYDPETGEYYQAPQAPYAQGMGRRAMTPPPRGAGDHRYQGDHGRHYSTMSAGYGYGGPRGRPGQRAPPKKKLPPPKALTSLPTPHMLKDDTALIMSPIDFAPPTSFREQQNGRRPDSPMGIQRPFSPAVRAYSPLVSAHSSLAAIPSPHLLRRSGTFTSLDFAPVPRFVGQEGAASDAGSIRSARSGISAMQMDAVRAGAYRVSRIPKEMVTTRDDLSNQLRPRMNLSTPA